LLLSKYYAGQACNRDERSRLSRGYLVDLINKCDIEYLSSHYIIKRILFVNNSISPVVVIRKRKKADVLI
jgi:hypothetical protein